MSKQEWDYYTGRRQNLEKKKEGAPEGNDNAKKQRSQNDTVESPGNGRTREQLAERYGVSPATKTSDADLETVPMTHTELIAAIETELRLAGVAFDRAELLA